MAIYFIKHHGPRVIVEPARLGVFGMPIMAEQSLLQHERDLPPHYHKDQMEICYFVAGERLYHINGEMYKVGANQVFISWPNEIHWVDSAPYGRAVFYYLRVKLPRRPRNYLGLGAREGAALAAALRGMPRRYFSLDSQMRHMLAGAFRIAEREPDDLSGLELSLMLSGWLFLLVRSCAQNPEEAISPDITRSIGMIRDGAAAVTSVAELARAVGLSTSRFKAKFKREVGLSPWEYVLRRRVQVAKGRLLSGKATITRVGMELGFASSQHFASTFRRFTGRTPSDFIREGDGGHSKGGYDHVNKWVDDGITHGYVLD